MQLITTSLAGNLHVASHTINQMGLAAYVLAMSLTADGFYTVVVFRVPDNIAPELRRYLGVLPECLPEPEIDWVGKATQG